MKKINVSFLLIFFFVITASFSIRAQNNTMERLGIPGPISFDGTKYNFLRALNQNEGSYYQEYVPDKETTDNYNQMLIYKLFFSDWSVREFAENKMHQIEQFKNTDSISTSRMFHNADSSEWIVDYFLGEYTNDKKLSGVDYYIYRYKKIKLGYDSNAILAFVYNRHSNGKDPVHFLEEANKQKNYYLYKIGSTELPKIKLQPQKDLYLRDPEKVKGYSSELTASQQKAMDDFLAGTSFNNNHQYLQAIEKFKQAIKTDSTGNCGTHMSGTAYGEIGDCYSKLGDYNNAILYFDKGILINKYYPLTYLHKASTLLMQNKEVEAMKTLDTLISNNPKEPIAYAQRGLLFDSTQSKNALKDFKKFLQLVNEQNQEEALTHIAAKYP